MREWASHRGPAGIRLASSAVFMVGILLSGCRGSGSDGDSFLQMDLAISPTPPGVGPARLMITLHDTAGTPVSGARIQVEGNMSHAGMVPVVDTANMSEPGHYLVRSFPFNMAGDWILTVDVTLPDGRTVSFHEETSVTSVPPGLSPDTGAEGAAPDSHGSGSHGAESSPRAGSQGGEKP